MNSKKEYKRILMKLFNHSFRKRGIVNKQTRIKLRNLVIDKAMSFAENGVKPDLEAIIDSVVKTQ